MRQRTKGRRSPPPSPLQREQDTSLRGRGEKIPVGRVDAAPHVPTLQSAQSATNPGFPSTPGRNLSIGASIRTHQVNLLPEKQNTSPIKTFFSRRRFVRFVNHLFKLLIFIKFFIAITLFFYCLTPQHNNSQKRKSLLRPAGNTRKSPPFPHRCGEVQQNSPNFPTGAGKRLKYPPHSDLWNFLLHHKDLTLLGGETSHI